MTPMIPNHGTETYTQGFAEWMHEKIFGEEELTNGFRQVLQIPLSTTHTESVYSLGTKQSRM